MSFGSHLSTSLISSGIITLLLIYLPGHSFKWGLAFIVVGIVVGTIRLFS